MNIFHTIARKIRGRAAYRAAKRSRDAHMAAIQSRIHTARRGHGATKHLHEQARALTHDALRTKGVM